MEPCQLSGKTLYDIFAPWGTAPKIVNQLAFIFA